MAVATIDDVIETAQFLLGGIADDLNANSLEAAVNQALTETGWVLPISNDIKSHWIIERTRRHIIQILANVAAMKFQYKQIHLEHRFKHLNQLLLSADEAFSKFADENPELFVDAFASLGGADGFLTFITSGFEYDPLGIEI